MCVFFLSAMKNLKFLISYEYIIWSYIHLKILIIELIDQIPNLKIRILYIYFVMSFLRYFSFEKIMIITSDSFIEQHSLFKNLL